MNKLIAISIITVLIISIGLAQNNTNKTKIVTGSGGLEQQENTENIDTFIQILIISSLLIGSYSIIHYLR